MDSTAASIVPNVEVLGHYCIIRTTDHEQGYKFKQPLDAIRKKLNRSVFVQCHRGFVVNLMYVRHITSGSITMADGSTIPVGKRYQEQVMSQFRHYYLEGGASE